MPHAVSPSPSSGSPSGPDDRSSDSDGGAQSRGQVPQHHTNGASGIQNFPSLSFDAESSTAAWDAALEDQVARVGIVGGFDPDYSVRRFRFCLSTPQGLITMWPAQLDDDDRDKVEIQVVPVSPEDVQNLQLQFPFMQAVHGNTRVRHVFRTIEEMPIHTFRLHAGRGLRAWLLWVHYSLKDHFPVLARTPAAGAWRYMKSNARYAGPLRRAVDGVVIHVGSVDKDLIADTLPGQIWDHIENVWNKAMEEVRGFVNGNIPDSAYSTDEEPSTPLEESREA